MEKNHRWYAIQVYAGSEQSVKKAIENFVKENRLEDRIKEIIVPTEDVIDVKKGKKRITQRSLYPGYVFANISLDINLWHKIQSMPKVGRFIGESKKPTPLSEADVKVILEKAKPPQCYWVNVGFNIFQTPIVKTGITNIIQ
jgi:transcriptional antiterminator NusG